MSWICKQAFLPQCMVIGLLLHLVRDVHCACFYLSSTAQSLRDPPLICHEKELRPYMKNVLNAPNIRAEIVFSSPGQRMTSWQR